jgi:hypothetical protein
MPFPEVTEPFKEDFSADYCHCPIQLFFIFMDMHISEMRNSWAVSGSAK